MGVFFAGVFSDILQVYKFSNFSFSFPPIVISVCFLPDCFLSGFYMLDASRINSESIRRMQIQEQGSTKPLSQVSFKKVRVSTPYAAPWANDHQASVWGESVTSCEPVRRMLL